MYSKWRFCLLNIQTSWFVGGLDIYMSFCSLDEVNRLAVLDMLHSYKTKEYNNKSKEEMTYTYFWA